MFWARSGWERPAKTISRFSGPRSMKCSGDGSLTTRASSPGRASSVAVGLSMLLVDPPFLRRLSLRKPGQRTGRDILRDDGSGCNPNVVANLYGGVEHSVHTGPDVAADPGAPLRLLRLVREVGRDVAGGDVRALPHLGVSHIREVRDLRTSADRRVLDLDEGADLRVLADHAHRPDVGERPYLRSAFDADAAADDRVGLNDHVGLDLDAGLNPGRGRVDDRDAGEHVSLVDPFAEGGGGERELHARVHALGLEWIVRKLDGTRLPVGHEQTEGVGHVELALCVVRVEAFERR